MTSEEADHHPELGTLPVGWVVKSLPEELTFISGKAHERHINQMGQYVVVNSKFISSDGEVQKFSDKNFQPARSGDILMVMSDLPNGKALAKTFLVAEANKYAVNQRVCILRAKRGIPAYFRYQLNRNDYFLGFDDGVQQTHLLNRVFLECPIVVPETIEEQKAIAQALSDMDNLITSLDALIAKKRDIKQGAMHQLLAGKCRLPGFSAQWDIRSLSDVATFSKGFGLSKGEISDLGRYKCIHYGELFTGYPATISDVKSRTNFSDFRRTSKKNDVLMPTSDVTPTGLATASCIIEGGVILGGDILIISGKSCLWGPYLSHVIRWDRLQVLTLVSGTTVFHIYPSDMARFQIALPELSEQQAIAATLDQIDVEIADLEEKSAKYAMLRQGMMQQLLSGKIRLK